MDILRKLIQQELHPIMNRINENSFFRTAAQHENVHVTQAPADAIIYNYTQGREFAYQMQEDMNALSRYSLVEYLPINIEKEFWGYEFNTVAGRTLIIEIIRKIRGGKSFWYLRFSVMEVGQQIPEIYWNSGAIDGYEKFIEKINSTFVVDILNVDAY